ncbi:MAG: UbiA family prenyltransferase, partial [Bacillota bacterium]|nr:UbiA family prenyltransferase [Bacillota bacterium]
MKKYLKLMRIHHYLKNGLIFFPLIFGGQLFRIDLLIKTVYGFLGFSLFASVIYIINDIHDVEGDRMHAVKCKRPIASGAVSIRSAWILMFLLLGPSVIFNYLACGTN